MNSETTNFKLKAAVEELYKRLPEASRIEKEFLKKMLCEIGPTLSECLKLIQADMRDGEIILLHRKSLGVCKQGHTHIGTTSLTKQHIIVQVFEVISEEEVMPLDIEMYTVEEFLSQVRPIEILKSAIKVVLHLLNIEKTENSGNNFYI